MTDYRFTTDGKIYEVTGAGDRRLSPERERITRERFQAAGIEPGVVRGAWPAPGGGYDSGALQLVRTRPEPPQEEPVEKTPIAEIRPRDLVVKTSQEDRDGQTMHRVRLEHKPTRINVEAEGPTYETARRKADLQLEDALELTRDEEEAFS